MPNVRRVAPWLVAGALASIGVAELGARLVGAVDFPVYHADNVIGYIPAPSQHGAFLNKNTWRFNSLSMGAEEFRPSPAALDVLLVGDSIVLGGNPYREEDRLGPQLAMATGSAVWPISAGSWALLNELTYLRLHPEVVRAADAIVFVVNSGDFNHASSWACELTHPRERPLSAVVYLARKYGLGKCPPVRAEMTVPPADWKPALAAFLASPEARDKRLVFALYPDRAEVADEMALGMLEARAEELRRVGVNSVLSVGRDPRWKAATYRDEIHPTLEATRTLAAILADAVAHEAPLRAFTQ